jgi:hypothetical protein
MVAWESPLERDGILLMELSPGVISYQEQPEEISYWDGESMCIYVPDLHAYLWNEALLIIEVKPVKELERPVVKEKYTRIAEALLEQGKCFLLLTEQEIRQEPQFSNLKLLLYWYNHAPTPLPTAKEISTRLKGRNQATIQDCLDIFGASIAYALIAKGLLVADLSLVLTPASPVRLPEGGSDAAIYF